MSRRTRIPPPDVYWCILCLVVAAVCAVMAYSGASLELAPFAEILCHLFLGGGIALGTYALVWRTP